MNNIEEAAALLEQGWCTGEIKDDQDRHCAVGAVAAATNTIVMFKSEGLEGFVDEEATYAAFDKTLEGKALADEVMESAWFANQDKNLQTVLLNHHRTGNYCDVVFYFNDKQSDKEPVIEMFRYAAKRMH